MTIKFSYPFSKLRYGTGQLSETSIWVATLLQVIELDYSDLTQEMKDYDTDFGKFKLPAKGPCIMLIFMKPADGGLFTTIRRSIPHKVDYYKRAVGKTFDVEVHEPVS